MEMVKIEKVIVGNEKKTSSAEIKSDPVITPDYYPHESLQCFQCLIVFKDRKAKDRHFKRSHREEYTHQLQQSNTLFMCYKCKCSFSTAEELNQHQPTHFTEEKPFVCSLCQKRFCTLSELNKHTRKDCDERRHLCEICGARFPMPFRLRKHRIAMHPEKEVSPEDAGTCQCLKCGVVFQTEEELFQHQQEFANCDLGESRGEKRACDPKSETQEVEVDKKIKKEEDTNGYEGHSDSTPGASSVEFKIPCPEEDCDCMFPSVEALRAHKKDRHGTRPPKAPNFEYTCLTCGESFVRESTLLAHQTSHIKKEEVVDQR